MAGPFSIDTYLPAFPAIAREFGLTPFEVQQTMAIYLASFAVMTLFHGTLSDSFGRRPVILANLVLFIVATLGCSAAQSFGQLLAFRALQGISAGAGIVVGRAIIRDTFEGFAAQRLLSLVTMIFGIAPAIAPVIGGWIQSAHGWRSIFVFLACYGALLLAVCSLRLPETLPRAARQPFAPAPLAAGYLKLGSSAPLLLLSFATGLNWAGGFLYVASAPAIIYNLLGLATTQFAVLFVPGISGIMIGAWVSGRSAGRVSARRTVNLAYAVMFGAAAASLAYHLLAPPAIPWTIVPFMVYGFGMALAMPSIVLLALDLFPAQRGLTASLQGFIQTACAAFTAGVVAPLAAGSGETLALAMLALVTAGWLAWAGYGRTATKGCEHAGA
ncbi:MAG: multidrug effflux MFS transporter [Burkholderiales bacterium]|nr:multidrug effflux MFS transporter [Burkholderiales bacterium]